MKLNEIFSKIINESYTDLSGIPDLIPYTDIIKSYFHRRHYIYRGMSATSDFILGDATNMNRTSANTNGLVNTFVDYFHPKWKKFPKRSKSFICSNDIEVASQYGENFYYVIPLQNQPLAISSDMDFWYSFEALAKNDLNISDLDDLIGRCFKKVDDVDFKSLQNNISLYKQILMKTDEYFKANKFDETNDTYINKLFGKGFIKALRTILDPDANDFELLPSNNFGVGHSVEIWMSGKVLFINSDIDIEELLEELQ